MDTPVTSLLDALADTARRLSHASIPYMHSRTADRLARLPAQVDDLRTCLETVDSQRKQPKHQQHIWALMCAICYEDSSNILMAWWPSKPTYRQLKSKLPSYLDRAAIEDILRTKPGDEYCPEGSPSECFWLQRIRQGETVTSVED